MTNKKKPVEKIKAENISQKSKKDDEPSWYHYLLVLAILAAFIGIFWAGYYFFVEDEQPTNNGITLYKYSYKVGNVTYNLYFESPASEIKEMPYPIEVDKYDLLNTINFRMAFDNYTGSDNGQVAKASTKLTSFLKFVYQFKFYEDSFLKTDVINCENSTLREKVITFDPYTNETGIFYNETNGCIQFRSDNATKMIDLTDKFIYEMVDFENVD